MRKKAQALPGWQNLRVIFYARSFSSNGSPHSGQNFGGCGEVCSERKAASRTCRSDRPARRIPGRTCSTRNSHASESARATASDRSVFCMLITMSLMEFPLIEFSVAETEAPHISRSVDFSHEKAPCRECGRGASALAVQYLREVTFQKMPVFRMFRCVFIFFSDGFFVPFSRFIRHLFIPDD